MTVTIETTKYYEDFLSYFDKAKRQQELCNLGIVPHSESGVGDSLMENVELYDVVERKYAGFSQIVNDVFYGWDEEHPYWVKMDNGYHTKERKQIAKRWTGKRDKWGDREFLYLFLLHRITGSAINYARIPSGYHNTLLPDLHETETVEEMVDVLKSHPGPFYTSIGYQFPAFPKPPAGYKRGGDYYLSELAPRLVDELLVFLADRKHTFREIGDWMFDWNVKNGLRKYKFQYAAFLADIADWMPDYVEQESPFYYGSNAVECISYLAKPTERAKKEDFLDAVMARIYKDTGSVPYNAEDVACDYIRWVENYIRPGDSYNHLDRDEIWNSSSIDDHPFGRQKRMLEFGLIDSFNSLGVHPSDDYVLRMNGLTAADYKLKCTEHVTR
jgi:hypothetical protein